MSRQARGSLLIALVAVSWGAIGVIVRELPLPALTIVAFRVVLSALSVAAFVLVTRRPGLLRPPPWRVMALGLLLAAHWGLYFAALKETSVASAVLITYAAPILMALLAAPMLGERVPRVSVMALAVSAAGVAVITLSGGTGEEAVRSTGAALAVGAAVSMALLIVLIKRFAAGVDPLTTSIYLDFVAACVLWPALVVPAYEVGAADAGYLALLGVVLTGLTGVIYLTALRWVPATTAGILAYMEPVSAALLAAVLLGEGLSVAVIAGGAAIVAAGVVVVLRTSGAVATAVEAPAGSGPRDYNEPRSAGLVHR